MTHLCEVCKIEEVEVTHQSVLGTYQVCKKCDGTLKYIREEEFIAYTDISAKVQAELVPNLCAGWINDYHIIEGKVIYLLAVKADGAELTNLFKFCRSCFLDYANSEFNQRV